MWLGKDLAGPRNNTIVMVPTSSNYSEWSDLSRALHVEEVSEPIVIPGIRVDEYTKLQRWLESRDVAAINRFYKQFEILHPASNKIKKKETSARLSATSSDTFCYPLLRRCRVRFRASPCFSGGILPSVPPPAFPSSSGYFRASTRTS